MRNSYFVTSRNLGQAFDTYPGKISFLKPGSNALVIGTGRRGSELEWLRSKLGPDSKLYGVDPTLGFPVEDVRSGKVTIQEIPFTTDRDTHDKGLMYFDFGIPLLDHKGRKSMDLDGKLIAAIDDLRPKAELRGDRNLLTLLDLVNARVNSGTATHDLLNKLLNNPLLSREAKTSIELTKMLEPNRAADCHQSRLNNTIRRYPEGTFLTQPVQEAIPLSPKSINLALDHFAALQYLKGHPVEFAAYGNHLNNVMAPGSVLNARLNAEKNPLSPLQLSNTFRVPQENIKITEAGPVTWVDMVFP